MEHSGNENARLDRVETEVANIRTDMSDFKSEVKSELGSVRSDVRGLSGILTRIEEGVAAAQTRQDQREQQARINPVAVVTVIITVLSMMVGGSWMISGALATTSVRLDDQDKQTTRIMDLRNREFDQLNGRITRLEDNRGEPGAHQ